ncbi:hypothetical protein FNV43_RR13189 [Rhamnella rubrinervis]|uniref:Uncharacterized protein n=1 Tax=Rhamnella rubrinervis TaxID=2594499 RepID=A0A8K0H0L1_9ROSA|nr:hypothetical protein FNV43_RR13189 [Rhamnella rubrinervis]
MFNSFSGLSWHLGVKDQKDHFIVCREVEQKRFNSRFWSTSVTCLKHILPDAAGIFQHGDEVVSHPQINQLH